MTVLSLIHIPVLVLYQDSVLLLSLYPSLKQNLHQYATTKSTAGTFVSH